MYLTMILTILVRGFMGIITMHAGVENFFENCGNYFAYLAFFTLYNVPLGLLKTSTKTVDAIVFI